MTSPQWKVAVVGAGPAGMFMADSLTRREDVRVDLVEKLFAPDGLLRFGVAPDHPHMKRLGVAFNKTRERPNLRLLGGVEYGEDIDLEEIYKHYHHVVFAHGAVSDRRLGIPGEELKGVLSAREFVEWYNGHPEAVDHPIALDMEEVVVVGAGNVALDVARVLIRPVEELAKTDIATHALEALRHSKVKKVHMLIRRGPAGVSFTLPEVRELSKMDGVRMVISEEDFRMTEEQRASLESDRMLRRIIDVLESCVGPVDVPDDPRKVLQLHFFTSPIELTGDGSMEALRCVRNEIVPNPEGGRARCVPIEGSEFTLNAGMLLRSIGYRVEALPGLPYDEEKQVIRNEGGHVIGDDGKPLGRVWVTGWARRGPSGVLGTNKADASEVAKTLLGMCPEGEAESLPEWAGTVPRLIDLETWARIDAEEQRRGKGQDRPREKFVRLNAVHEFLDTPVASKLQSEDDES